VVYTIEHLVEHLEDPPHEGRDRAESGLAGLGLRGGVGASVDVQDRSEEIKVIVNSFDDS